jgi:hypothetical protein
LTGLFFTIVRTKDRDELEVELKNKHGYNPPEYLREIQRDPQDGPLITGVWRRKQRVWSARQERIQIKYGKKALMFTLIMKVLPSLPMKKPPI